LAKRLVILKIIALGTSGGQSMKWDEEAKEALSRVPFFIRKKLRKRVEEEAERCGAREVRLEHVRSCQRRLLDNMEDEVEGYRVETCFGPSGCPNRAVTDTGLAKQLEERLARRDLKSFLRRRVRGPLKIHHEFRVSVSDCPNACSRPQIVDVGLIGARSPRVSNESCSQCGACAEACAEGAIIVQSEGPVLTPANCLACGKCITVCPTGTLQTAATGYRLLVGGKLGRHPRLGTELRGIHPTGEALEIVDRCLDLYERHCLAGERFGEILERVGEGGIAEDLGTRAGAKKKNSAP
jgi:anaerobic sulfite reductase subunit C